jgi:predicted secreted acid phosphatase
MSIQIIKSYANKNMYEGIEDIKKIFGYFLTNKKKCCVVFDIDDTLIESEMGKSILEVKDLYVFCEKNEIPCFFITARLKETEVFNQTLKELRKHGIIADENNLKLSPASWRDTFPKISLWKKKMRQKISDTLGCKITFSIGDQWGDLLQISEKDYQHLNNSFYSDMETLKKSKALLLRTKDDVGMWGFKILSNVEEKGYLKNLTK